VESRRFVACAIVVAASGVARAGTMTISNGVTGAGSLSIDLDDYGAYGTGIGPQEQDNFQPTGQATRYATYMAGAYLAVTTPADGMRTSVLLTDYKKWESIVSGQNGNGVTGDRALARTIMTANTMVGPDHLTSVFIVGEPGGGGVQLQIALDQKLVYDSTKKITTLRQAYAITNTGSLDTNLGFHAHWDPDLIWVNSVVDDIGGVGMGRCYVYIRDMAGTDQAVSLHDGGSTVPRTYYYVGKAGVTPMMGPPDFASTAYTSDVFTMYGMPPSWRNCLATVGYDVAGETPVLAGSGAGGEAGNAEMGTEYHFPLATGASETIVIERIYGTSDIACPAPPPGTCGDGIQDPNEQCDTFGADTIDCIGATCMASTCGDGYVNSAAGELCDPSGVDTAACVAATCQPSTCGDGYVNAAAGEECEGGALCDALTCKVTYTVGGGCAGCNTDASPPWWLALVLLWRRRARSRSARPDRRARPIRGRPSHRPVT